ncbi:MAG: TVP38/TMEM64 family protein [Bacilli bacterium]|nr:TVP38/TMEM64 family protein [Bacilli bacterium]
MSELFNTISDYINIFIENLGVWGPLLGCLLIVVESILPVLPIFVFITLNFLAFGNIVGFLISWLCTVLGCFISFMIFRDGVQTWFEKRLRNKSAVDKIMNVIDKLKFEHLVLLLTVPFVPAFAINIAAGLSKMKLKKYVTALFIGKAFFVYFWGFVGTGLLESLTNPSSLIKVLIIIIIAYILSRLISKKVKN